MTLVTYRLAKDTNRALNDEPIINVYLDREIEVSSCMTVEDAFARIHAITCGVALVVLDGVEFNKGDTGYDDVFLMPGISTCTDPLRIRLKDDYIIIEGYGRGIKIFCASRDDLCGRLETIANSTKRDVVIMVDGYSIFHSHGYIPYKDFMEIDRLLSIDFFEKA